jgi:hypothetical protein
MKRMELWPHYWTLGGFTMRTPIVFILAILSAITVNASPAQQMRQYAAKFVCGKASDEQMKLFNFAPGQYFTTINVHNPARNEAVKYQKKFALAESSEKAGRISEWFKGELKADEAMQIDCRNIYAHTNTQPGSFVEGFVVIELPPTQELDVVGVYTAAGNAGVSAMHMERVAGRLTQ